MAIGATISKVALGVADMDRHHYESYSLTLAQHPSETDFRMMIRIVAYALNCSEHLEFTTGLGADNQAEIWCKSLSGEIDLWIDFGQVDEKRIRKACGQAKQVVIYTYSEQKGKIWWQQNQGKLQRHDNLSVFHISAEGVESLIGRSMNLQCNIQDGVLTLFNDDLSCDVNVSQYV